MIPNYLRNFSFILLLCILPGFGSEPLSAQDSSVTQPEIRPTWLWGAAQVIPSPQWVTADAGMRFGMRWQATPVLYSFGLNRRVSPWRFFVAEPLARQNGSLEFFISPEYLNITADPGDRWLLRGGLRGYFPIYRYGEYVSGSLATSVYTFQGKPGVSYEAGVYFFFGIIGLQTTYSPEPGPGKWTFTLRLRYF